MHPFSTRNTDVITWGLQLAGLPPGTPLLSFYAVHGMLSRTSIKKNCLNLIMYFQGRRGPRQAAQARFKHYPASKSRTAMSSFRTRDADVDWACKWGRCPPNPPLSFYAVHGLRTTKKNPDGPFQNHQKP